MTVFRHEGIPLINKLSPPGTIDDVATQIGKSVVLPDRLCDWWVFVGHFSQRPHRQTRIRVG